MNTAAILDAVRQDYLRFYRRALENVGGGRATPEILLQLNGVDRNAYRALYRVDIMYKKGDEPQLVEVNLDRCTAVQQTQVQHADDLILEFHPMVWNGVQIRTDLAELSDSALRGWYERWLDSEGSKPRDPTGFSSVIHSFDARVGEDGQWEVSVDFGSAPVDAVIELLELLRQQGAKILTMGSWSFEGET